MDEYYSDFSRDELLNLVRETRTMLEASNSAKGLLLERLENAGEALKRLQSNWLKRDKLFAL